MTQVARNRRRPAAAALLCAVVVAGGTGDGAAAVAGPRPGPAEAAQRLPSRVDALYGQASRASARYEAARRKAAHQRAAVARAQRAVSRGHKRLDALHELLGSVARSQYRHGGWALGTRLVLSRSPESLLERLRAQRQGDHAFQRLLRTTKTTQRRLQRNRARAHRVLELLKENAARQRDAKDTVERRLAEARRKLARAEAARKAREAATAGPVLRAARSAAAGSSDGCPVGEPPGGGADSGATWVRPVRNYTLSAGFASSGARWSNGHTGQDFAVPTGTPVHAVGKGTVDSVECGGPFGNQIVVRHPNGYYTQYAHLSQIQTRRGAHVAAGEQIGLSGSTGNSTGPHLHFEVRLTPQVGSAVEPVRWLRDRGVRV
ncbi:M23 family metallopeptidase [Streptomyces cacaoi]|uniref:M23 family metallopeptidase n=1 Tax=Streptomyces cacaoi TaxID=1898 RepID=UPI00261B6702|nr:M23 family metallopeptidase [Streptomyces cacaoi]